MSAPIYLTTLCLFLGTILIVFGIRAVSAVLQARTRRTNDADYRALAERTNDALAGVDTRLTAIEKVLKDVG